MKKYFLVIVILVIAISSIFFFKYKDYQTQKREIEAFNSQYELYNKKINGLDVISVINKATSNNEKYEIPKDENGIYLLDEEYSIEIFVVLELDELTLNMEKIISSDITNFVRHFGEISFKCSEITYHEKTGRIATMTFNAEEY